MSQWYRKRSKSKRSRQARSVSWEGGEGPFQEERIELDLESLPAFAAEMAQTIARKIEYGVQQLCVRADNVTGKGPVDVSVGKRTC